MSDLYSDNRTTSSDTDVAYSTSNGSIKDKYFQEFREFDYAIDISDNIIMIQDVIQTGQLFDFVSILTLTLYRDRSSLAVSFAICALDFLPLSVSDFNCPHAAIMSSPRGFLMGLE